METFYLEKLFLKKSIKKIQIVKIKNPQLSVGF